MIRLLQLEDLPTLQRIAQDTFLESFGAENKPQDIQDYLEEKMSLKHLHQEMQNPESAFYGIPAQAGLCAYLKLNWGQAQSEKMDALALEVERIYVRATHQGQGLGQVLFDKALEFARLRNASYLWLGVWEKNLKAMHFYQKQGMQKFGEHNFLLGEDLQTDCLMKLELNHQKTNIPFHSASHNS